MKKIILAALIFITAQAYAQYPSMPSSMKNSGHLYGKVTDADGKGIEGASVLLLHQEFDATTKKMKMVLVTGVTTKGNGDFNFTSVPVMGKLQLRISNAGFKSLQDNTSFTMPKMSSGGAPTGGSSSYSTASLPFDKDLGNIKLETDVKTLAGVTVVGSTPTLKMDIDKKVFNVEKNIVSAGGTAVDVMRNVPSVQVDIDGNVKLRNAAPTIYVDGHPTTLSLDEIPADAIQSVEVITNPSAKYDASGGSSGILNIVLKKNKATGYNGNVTAGIDSRGGINAGANFNVRQGKVNFTASGMLHQNKGYATGETDRTNLGDTLTKVSQSDINKTNGQFMFGKLGLDYYITNRATISLGAVKVHGNFNPNDVIHSATDSLLNSGVKSENSVRYTSGTRSFDADGLQLDYVYNFPKDGEQLTANGNYFSGKTPSNQLYTTNYLDENGNIAGTQLQQVINGGSINFLTMQTDYALPFGKQKQSKFETGLRFQQHQSTQSNDNYLGSNTGNLAKVPAGTNDYSSTDNVFAGYVSLKSTIKNFGYEVGVRAESSNYNGELTNTGEKFSNNYPVSLFPSLFLSQKLKKNQELQFSYTRRINRPNFFQLIPFTDYTDSLNITRGNPNLVPEFTNSLEMSYDKTFKGGNSFLGSIYYKHSTNLITRYLTPGVNPFSGQNDIINTYINANSSYSYGAELTSINKVTKWWDMTTNVNVYQSHINTDNIPGSTSQDALVSWFGKLNNNFKLPSNFTIQLSGDYQSKTNLPINNSQGGPGGGGPFGQAQSSSQGYIRSIWGTDIAVKKSFLKNNAASLTLSMSDIFRTRIQDQYSVSPYFVQNYSRLNNPQLFRVSFAYHFGKMDVNLFKRKNNNATGSQDMMQMAQ